MSKKKQKRPGDAAASKPGKANPRGNAVAAARANDTRTRNIIIGVVAVLIIAVIAALVVVALKGKAQDQEAQSGVAIDLGEYADGSPIVLSKDGIGKPDSSVPTLTEYFDYTCHHCVNVDAAAGEQLSEAAKAGKINIKYQPVMTVDMAYTQPATTASLIVAQKEPEKWADFHHALMGYFKTAYDAQDGTIVGDSQASFKAVKEVAAQSGISQDVIDTFVVNGVEDYLNKAQAAWRDAKIEGRGDQLGTPEYVANDSKEIALTSFEGPAVIKAVEDALGVKLS